MYDFKTYFEECFNKDLTSFISQIPVENNCHPSNHCNLIIQYFHLTPAYNYLSIVPTERQSHFVVSIYWTVLIDQVLYTHFKSEYEKFRRYNVYPKFIGNCTNPSVVGSACGHNLHPQDILRAVNDFKDKGNKINFESFIKDRTSKRRQKIIYEKTLFESIPVIKKQVELIIADSITERVSLFPNGLNIDWQIFWKSCFKELPIVIMGKIHFTNLDWEISPSRSVVVDGDETDLQMYLRHGGGHWFGGEDEEEYNRAVEEIKKIAYTGHGWKLIAKIDESGYHHWMKKKEERNRIDLILTFDSEYVDIDECSIINQSTFCASTDTEEIEGKFDYNPDPTSLKRSFEILTDENGNEVRISKRTKLIRVDVLGSYLKPVDAVAGINDCGDAKDSPAPTKTATAELKMLTDLLDKEKILWIEMSTSKSKVYCNSRYIVTQKKDRTRAAKLAESLRSQTKLLFIVTE